MHTLFLASIGDFDIDEMASKVIFVSKTYMEILMTVFLVCNLIILLNLLIAILSDTYNIFKAKSTELYLYQIAKLKGTNSMDDERYSALIAGQVPFNLLVIPFVPFLIFFKSKRLNTFVLHILYLPIGILCFLEFICISTLLIPVAYIMSVFVKFKVMVDQARR